MTKVYRLRVKRHLGDEQTRTIHVTSIELIDDFLHEYGFILVDYMEIEVVNQQTEIVFPESNINKTK